MELYQILKEELKQENNFVTDDGELKKWVVINKAQNYDATLIAMLLRNETLKKKFFMEIETALVFNQKLFLDFLEQKNYLNDSYTKYKNKIGLTIDGKFLKQRNEVALVWPFKDCILEGGQSKEEQKKNEIFFNETLAQDEITQLTEPKVLTNAKVYTQNGEQAFETFERNADINKARGLAENTITDNLIIKGNNLLALHSLKKEFAGKVKLIYIDPPYNTGKDSFQYNDSFNHSTWLTFMKNRLEIAKDLLKKDGVIFVSLDDKEAHYCKVLMDSIFGRDNFIADICHKSRGSVSNDKIISPNHNHLLLYAKNERTIYKNKGKFGIKKQLKGFNLKDKRGYYKLVPVTGPGGASKANPFYEFLGIKGYWRFSKERMNQMYKEGLIVKTENSLLQKYYKSKAANSKQTVTTWWEDGFLTSSATASLKKLMGDKVFGNPKNVNLLKRIVELWVNKNDIVLDFFGGSGTTAHAVLALNQEDNKNRKFILIEQLDKHADICIQRNQKVIQQENLNASFTYLELKKYNEIFVEQIQSAADSAALLLVWESMKAKSFLNYNIDIQKQEAHLEEFKALAFAEQQQILLAMLDKNQLYVNMSSLEDAEFACSDAEKQVSKAFYSLL